MSPLCTLRATSLFGQRPHRSSGQIPAAVVRSGRQEPARGPHQGNHQTVARGCLAARTRRYGDPISFVESDPFPSRWSDQS